MYIYLCVMYIKIEQVIIISPLLLKMCTVTKKTVQGVDVYHCYIQCCVCFLVGIFNFVIPLVFRS